MNLDEIRNYINFEINKEQLGEPTSPKQYNTLLKVVNIEKYGIEYNKYLIENNPNSPMNRFKRIVDTQTVNGDIELPSDYTHFISLLEGDEPYKVVNIVSDKQLDNARFNLLEEQELPIGAIYHDKVKVFPQASKKAELKYFRSPLEPYYDTCLDSEDNEIYMPEGSYVQFVDGQYNLYDKGNQILEQDVTYGVIPVNHAADPNIDYKQYKSRSIELDWNETEHMNIAELILVKVGKNMRDQAIMK